MKLKIKLKLLVILFFVCFQFSEAQNLDSLRALLNTSIHDTTKCQILNVLIENESDDSVWPVYNTKLKKICEDNLIKAKGDLKKYYQQYYALAFNNMGYDGMMKSNYTESFNNYSKALKISEEINDKSGLSTAYLNIGFLFRHQGNTNMALEYYHKALKIQIEIGDKRGVATSYNNIGFVLSGQNEMISAIENYEKALPNYIAIDDKEGIAVCYVNLAFAYKEIGDPYCKGSKEECFRSGVLKSIDYLNKASKIQTDLDDKKGLANSINMLGGIYENIGDPSCKLGKAECDKINNQLALDYYLKALQLRKEVGSKTGLSMSYNTLAEHYLKTNEIDKALQNGLLSLSVSKEVGSPEKISLAALVLKKIYEKKGDFKESLKMYELHILMKDSISNDETKRNALKKGFQAEYETQHAKDSLINVAKIEQEKFKSDLAVSQQKTYTYFGLFGFALMLLIALVSFRAFKNKQKANVIITQQKIFSEEQRLIIEEKQKEVLDSIHYASRIQRAMLTSSDYIEQHLQAEYFIFYQPKDIVSGDFYWAAEHEGKFYMATADCTGHGVPGAFMSLLNISFLNENLIERNILSPDKILNEQRKEIVKALNPKGNENSKDGMDCVLCAFDLNTDKPSLEFAAANNPLWLVRNGEMLKFSADKMPVGKYEESAGDFKLNKIELQKNDIVYTFTDGYADQFGGPKGKKFMYKQLEETILSNAHLAMAEQHKVLMDKINDWKGNTEQIDDILVVGIRI